MQLRLLASIVTAIAVLVLSGCAATVVREPTNKPLNISAEARRTLVLNFEGDTESTASKDWEQFKGAWVGAMKAAAGASGVEISSQEGPPKPTNKPGTLVAIHVNEYRYLSAGVRYGFGIMTGNAFVDSRVRYLDLDTGALLGERAYKTTSTAWEGVFSAMTEKQLDAICKQMLTDMEEH